MGTAEASDWPFMPCSSGKSWSLPLVVAAGVELMRVWGGLKRVVDMEVSGINMAIPEQINTTGRKSKSLFLNMAPLVPPQSLVPGGKKRSSHTCGLDFVEALLNGHGWFPYSPLMSL